MAALLSLALGLGFGLPCVSGIKHFSRTREVWTFMGFPTYGGGPFESAGIPTSTPLLSGFLTVCAAEVVLAGLIWKRHRQARLLSVLLLPVEMLFWIGFALPFGPPLGIARTALLLADKPGVSVERPA
jgi:hypothetical protein